MQPSCRTWNSARWPVSGKNNGEKGKKAKLWCWRLTGGVEEVQRRGCRSWPSWTGCCYCSRSSSLVPRRWHDEGAGGLGEQLSPKTVLVMASGFTAAGWWRGTASAWTRRGGARRDVGLGCAPGSASRKKPGSWGSASVLRSSRRDRPGGAAWRLVESISWRWR